MNRLEQIKKWAQQREAELSSHYQAFVLGATVADQNPDHELFNKRLELEKEEWLDKACEWLSQQEELVGISFEKDFYERFKKYMEDK